MSQAFHVSCSKPSVPLFRLKDGRFQLTKDGPIAPFMDGFGYFLIQPDLAQFIEELDVDRIQFEPAIVWHRANDLEYGPYLNLRAARFFKSQMIDELDLAGYKMYSLNDTYLFVSPALKQKLEASPFKYLSFSEGLSRFAADLD
jgi:hypothetical protein